MINVVALKAATTDIDAAIAAVAPVLTSSSFDGTGISPIIGSSITNGVSVSTVTTGSGEGASSVTGG